jgi:hypothetical protein
VEVVETINQVFNTSTDSGEERRACVFVLGMDRRVVSANIDVAYDKLVARLTGSDPSQASSYGLEFLSKVVQITVAVPNPNRSMLVEYIAALYPPETDTPEDKATELAALDANRAEAQNSTKAESGTSAMEHTRTVPTTAAVEKAAREIFDGPSQVREVELELLSSLRITPRQVKHFHNAFLLQLSYAIRLRQSVGISPGDMFAYARWSLLCVRHPTVAELIFADPSLLKDLERFPLRGSVEADAPQRVGVSSMAWKEISLLVRTEADQISISDVRESLILVG